MQGVCPCFKGGGMFGAFLLFGWMQVCRLRLWAAGVNEFETVFQTP